MDKEKNIAERARELAYAAHDGQFRRDGVTPYIVHPEAVAAFFPYDEDAAAVAWLHDTVEDRRLSFFEIRALFPPRIDIAVQAITKMDRGAETYDEYLRRVMTNPLARKVKYADMLCNLADNPTDRQRIKYTKALAKYLPLIGELR